MFDIPLIELCGELFLEFLNVGLDAQGVGIGLRRVDRARRMAEFSQRSEVSVFFRELECRIAVFVLH